MAKILKFKRGNTAKNNAYTGSAGELTVDTSKKTVVVHDGVTTGGSVLATEVTVSTHTSRVDNPHGVSKTQVGLGNVPNVDSTNPNNIVQDSTHRFVTDSDKTNWNGKINATEKAVANGVATLDVNGKVVLTQIPDSVLGQLEYIGTYSFSGGMPTATQKGQYWIASADGNGYITGDWAVWNGTSFDKVDNTDAVATVAGRTGNVVLTKNDVGLNNVDNTSDANKPVSTAQQTALNLKANIASPTFTGTVTAPAITGALNGNASTATKLATARTISLTGDVTGSVSFDGSANVSIPVVVENDSHEHTELIAIDNMSIKPNATGINNKKAIKAFFTSKEGLTGASGTDYQDLIVLDTYVDFSGGYVNALAFDKSSKTITHYQSSQSSDTWGTGRDLAYTDSSITGNAATATKLQTTRSISLTGDVTGTVNFDGSADASITTTIAANSVALGTDTTGNYVAGLTQGTGITVSGTAGEGWSPTVAITNVGTAGTYTKVTTNAQGQVTAGAQMTLEDIPDSTFKKSVRCATTANLAATYASNVLTMSAVGVTTIDGITVALNDRILIKDQTTALQNGIYRVSTLGTASVATVFTRVADADATSELASALVAVDSGTVNGGRLFDNDLKTTDTIGTTDVTFNLVVDTGFASTVVGSTPGTAAIGTSTSYARADHVHPVQTTITGNASTATTLQTARTIGVSGDVTGTATSFNGSANITIPLTLSNSGVTAGTYRSITVDSKGRVTTGSNPTTISEYGITDAYTKTEVGTLAEFTAALG